MKLAINLLITAAFAASAVADETGKAYLDAYAKKLNGAKSIRSTYRVQTIGGLPANYTVRLSKPNLARLDGPTSFAVADGTHITTYDKVSKLYYVRPQDEAGLKQTLLDYNADLWWCFFKEAGLAKVPEAHHQGMKMRKGLELRKVEAPLDLVGKKIRTFFFDKDSVAQQAETKLITTGGGTTTNLLDCETLELGDEPISPEKFVFQAPDDATEYSQSDISNPKWYTNFNEAMRIGQLTNRLVLVNFGNNSLPTTYFSIKGFKERSKDYVFCLINTVNKENLKLAEKYLVTQSPEIHFMKHDGTDFHQTRGFFLPIDLVRSLDRAKELYEKSK